MAYQKVNCKTELNRVTNVNEIARPSIKRSLWQRILSNKSGQEQDRNVMNRITNNRRTPQDAHKSETLEIAQSKAMIYYRRF